MRDEDTWFDRGARVRSQTSRDLRTPELRCDDLSKVCARLHRGERVAKRHVSEVDVTGKREEVEIQVKCWRGGEHAKPA